MLEFILTTMMGFGAILMFTLLLSILIGLVWAIMVHPFITIGILIIPVCYAIGSEMY